MRTCRCCRPEQLLGLREQSSASEAAIAIVVDVDGRRAALMVDRLLGQQQVVIKSLEANFRRVPGIAGATVLGNGRVALILDVNGLLQLEIPTAELAASA